MLDARIDNARIYSGADPATPGEHGETGSVGIRGGRMVLDPPADEPARQIIDAGGHVLCPGFIDIHAHSDFAALYAGDAVSKTLAGYTTELNGNCGYGAFPLVGPMKDARQAEYAGEGLEINWETCEEYFQRCEAEPMALNQGLLLGQGALRGSVVGLDDVAADREQQQLMQRTVEQAMRQGCFGISTGLVYAPGSFASPGEIRELVRVVAAHDGLYASHLRSESDDLLEALDEFLGTCEQTRCRAQYSHVKCAGRRNWHKLGAVRRRMDEARARGLEVWADRYPYTASSTDLATILLPNAYLGGGRSAIIERLKNPSIRAEIKRRIEEREGIGTEGPGWYEQVMICGVRNTGMREAHGKTLATWADHVGSADPLEAAFDLLIADEGLTYGIHFSMSQENLREVLSWPDVMIGSDSCVRDQVGERCKDRPHPRAFGTPARVLGDLARDSGVMDLATAIYKLTGQPAQVMRLKDRGLIRDGFWADVVIFDPSAIGDRATYEDPAQPPGGIEWVFVNGEAVVVTEADGKASPRRKRPGRLLRFGR